MYSFLKLVACLRYWGKEGFRVRAKDNLKAPSLPRVSGPAKSGESHYPYTRRGVRRTVETAHPDFSKTSEYERDIDCAVCPESSCTRCPNAVRPGDPEYTLVRKNSLDWIDMAEIESKLEEEIYEEFRDVTSRL